MAKIRKSHAASYGAILVLPAPRAFLLLFWQQEWPHRHYGNGRSRRNSSCESQPKALEGQLSKKLMLNTLTTIGNNINTMQDFCIFTVVADFLRPLQGRRSYLPRRPKWRFMQQAAPKSECGKAAELANLQTLRAAFKTCHLYFASARSPRAPVVLVVDRPSAAQGVTHLLSKD